MLTGSDPNAGGSLKPPNPNDTTADPKVAEAVDYVKSQGYGDGAAQQIVAEHGADKILADKAALAADVQSDPNQQSSEALESAQGLPDGAKAPAATEAPAVTIEDRVSAIEAMLERHGIRPLE